MSQPESQPQEDQQAEVEYDHAYEDPATEKSPEGGDDEGDEPLEPPSAFLSHISTEVQSFFSRHFNVRAMNHLVVLEDALPELTRKGKESLARNNLLLSAFQRTKDVEICVWGKKKLADGLHRDGQRPRFNLHRRVKEAAFQLVPEARPIMEYLLSCIEWFAAGYGWKVASLKILENEAEGWTGHKLHVDYPHFIRIPFHLPLVADCESGLVLSTGKGVSAESIWISDEQGRLALAASSYLLSGMHSEFFHAAAVRGHCLSVVVDFTVA